jgi:hypothetical protein
LGDSGVVEPAIDLLGVKADKLADLEIGDATFGDESADMAGAGAEPVDELVDCQQVGECVSRGHVYFLLAGATYYAPAFGQSEQGPSTYGARKAKLRTLVTEPAGVCGGTPVYRL